MRHARGLSSQSRWLRRIAERLRHFWAFLRFVPTSVSAEHVFVHGSSSSHRLSPVIWIFKSQLDQPLTVFRVRFTVQPDVDEGLGIVALSRSGHDTSSTTSIQFWSSSTKTRELELEQEVTLPLPKKGLDNAAAGDVACAWDPVSDTPLVANSGRGGVVRVWKYE